MLQIKIPDDIKLMYTIEVESGNPQDLMFIVNAAEQIWPETKLRSFAITGNEVGNASAALIMSNYELDYDTEEDEEDIIIE